MPWLGENAVINNGTVYSEESLVALSNRGNHQSGRGALKI